MRGRPRRDAHLLGDRDGRQCPFLCSTLSGPDRSWALLWARHEPERQVQSGGDALLDDVEGEMCVNGPLTLPECLVYHT